jgi:hypothetical protein
MADKMMKNADEKDEKDALRIEDLPAQAATPQEAVELKGGTGKVRYKDPNSGVIGGRSSVQ